MKHVKIPSSPPLFGKIRTLPLYRGFWTPIWTNYEDIWRNYKKIRRKYDELWSGTWKNSRPSRGDGSVPRQNSWDSPQYLQGRWASRQYSLHIHGQIDGYTYLFIAPLPPSQEFPFLRFNLCPPSPPRFRQHKPTRKTNPLTLSTLSSINSHIVFIWIPSYIGFASHDTIDLSAKHLLC